MSKPNILFILSDDQGAWSMGCAGNPDVKTPAMDALAKTGVRFDNFFCTSPVCSPARASIMTGKMPSQHGVHDWLARGYVDSDQLSDELKAMFREADAPDYVKWPKSQLDGDHAIRFLEGQRMYTEMLHEMGYDCALSGKWHLGDSGHPQGGFTWWKSIAMGGDNYFTPTVLEEDGKFHMRKDTYITDYITDNAITYLEERVGNETPFYLSVHYTAPHSPFDRASHPAELFAPFEDCAFSSIPNLPPHPWAREKDMTPEEWAAYREMSIHGYCAALYGMDRGMGRILQKLDELGLRENTLVIFTGDNGMNLGHHGIFGKGNGTFPMNMYEEAVKVPMIVSYPGHFREDAVESGMFSHADIFPTLAEFMGGQGPKGNCGRSFLAALEGKPCADNDDIVICEEYGPVRMVRTHTAKYIHRYPYGPNELYDLVMDPGETRNLADEPAYADLRARLKKRLDDFFRKYADPAIDGSREAVTGNGQIDRAGIYADGRSAYYPQPRG